MRFDFLQAFESVKFDHCLTEGFTRFTVWMLLRVTIKSRSRSSPGLAEVVRDWWFGLPKYFE